MQQYSPDPDAAVPYYRMGVRELGLPGGTGEEIYGRKVPLFNLHFDHMHFVGNEGSNFGLTDSGEFSESVEGLKKYQVEAPKYRKEYIDKARLDVAQEWKKKSGRYRTQSKFRAPALQRCRSQLPALLCRSSSTGTKIRNQRKTACAALEYRHHRWRQQAKSLG